MLQTLDISSRRITVEGCTALAKVLEGNNTLQSLDISRNEICDEGCAALAKALEGNNTLQSLNISRNKIGDEGCTALAKGLEGNNALQTLDITENGISVLDAAWLPLLRRNINLRLDDNPWKYPPAALMRLLSKMEVVIDFFQLAADHGQKDARVRLLFVGPGLAGKTTLASALDDLSNGTCVGEIQKKCIDTAETDRPRTDGIASELWTPG